MMEGHETVAATKDAFNDKMPDEDEIAHQLLSNITTLRSILRQLLQTSLHCQYYPEHFRLSITVSLSKPGKKIYSIFKA